MEAKIYVCDKVGWKNLLHINKAINVDNEQQVIQIDDLLSKGQGLFFVWSSHNQVELTKTIARKLKKAFNGAYYQYDAPEFQSNETDKRHLTYQQQLIINSYLPPILLNDAYYLDEQDSDIKKILNKIDKGRALKQSTKQYLKDLDDILDESDQLFTSEDDLFDYFQTSLDNLQEVAESCNYQIPTGQFRLPVYERQGDELQFASNKEFLYELIDRGLNEKVSDDDFDAYSQRVEEELDVIEEGGFVDYFLILWDIIEYCKRNNILTGIGRGSAGGSLVSYLLDITQMDPMEYDLIFSRFLNKGRIKVSMPDIDTDFESSRRDEVKRYIESRYGEDCVCSIGTYGTLKLRAAIQDFGRVFGIPSSTRNYLTKILEGSGEHWISLFQNALESTELMKFVQNQSHIVNTLPLCLNQPKNSSVHAAGVIIVPKTDEEGNKMTIFDWMPVKKVDGVLVSEWEGPQCEQAGFLKEDILGIKQLDKFRQIFDLIEKNKGKKLSLRDEDIPLDDPKVYDLFHTGCNGDLFHFGSLGLTSYSQDVKPVHINDLIAMIALYRPGAMLSQAHMDFVRIRNGEQNPQYDDLLDVVTKDTLGLYIYQEQVMKACQVIGDFTEVESDDIRRAMGKKKLAALIPYKERFINKATSKGYDEFNAEILWEKLEGFAGYGFNKSHAAAYSITGYKSQWLKYHYPMEYWTVALSNANDHELSRYISEIKKLDQGIDIVAPDINRSSTTFIPDYDNDEIYWSLRVKGVGPMTLDAIMEERSANGLFFSFEEFVSRMPRNKCKKGQILNLIIAGAFDKIENIKDVCNRSRLLKQYSKLIEPVNELYQSKATQNKHFWLIRQKELTGFGHLDYKTLTQKSDSFKEKAKHYVDPIQFLTEETTKKSEVIVGGIIKSVIERKTKAGDFFANITLETNDEELIVTMWKETWEPYKESIQGHKGGIALINGRVSFNDYHKRNTMQTQKSSSVVLI